MEIKQIIIVFLGAFLLVSCTSKSINLSKTSEVYVADFHSDDMESCRPSDVDLSHSQVHEFFMRAKQVDTRTLHDHYNYAPCHIEGTLNYESESCDWVIRAGSTGHIKCGDNIWYFACDECDDLFD